MNPGVLDALWLVAAFSGLLCLSLSGFAVGYDRGLAVGLVMSVLALPSAALTVGLTVYGIVSGRFDWTGTERWLQAVVGSGLLALLAMCFCRTFFVRFGEWPGVEFAALCLLFLGGFAGLHGLPGMGGPVQLAVVRAFLMSLAVAGWGWMGTAVIRNVYEDIAQSERKARVAEEQRQAQSAYESEEAAKFHRLPADATLTQVLPYRFAQSWQVRQEADARVAQWPARDEAIAALIREDYRWALSYVLTRPEPPEKQWDAAWGELLDWKRRQLEQLAGTGQVQLSDVELSTYSMGAQRLVEAGGTEVREPLARWKEFLQQQHVR